MGRGEGASDPCLKGGTNFREERRMYSVHYRRVCVGEEEEGGVR